jgi:hypothetical protein
MPDQIDQRLVAALALLAGLAACGCTCSRNQEPPPIPDADAAENTEPTKIQLDEEDAGTEVVDAATKSSVKGAGEAASLAKCCVALRQNAESSPQKERMLMAAGACEAAVNSGSAAGARAALGPFAQGLPAGCL